MTHPHRRTLLLAAAASLPLAAGRRAAAQDGTPYPARPVTLVNPYPAGGSTDFGARLIAARMEPELGQAIIVENRPGAGTAIANAHVAQQKPDGYALIMGTTSLAVLPALQPNAQPKDPRQAFDAIGPATRSPFVLHVHPDLPARTTAEFVAYARAHPGKLSVGSSGIGAINHMTLELFRARTGIDAVHVPYRGGAPALLDLQAGRIQAMFAAAQEAVGSIQNGRTRGIAVTSAERVAVLPDLSPIADTVPGFETVFWQGLFGPAGLPAPVRAKLEAALRAATSDQAVQARLAEQGIQAWSGDSDVLRATLARDTDVWGGIIRDQNIRLD